jgi:hypothetical protein
VNENRVLFGSKGTEVTGGWWKHKHEELDNIYSTANIVRMTIFTGSPVWRRVKYEGKSISKLQMNIELKQTRVLI